MLYEVTPLTRSPPRIVPLPIMVDPMEGEALISWCHRLGARLGFRPRETARMLRVDISDPAWWQRPRPETLLAISRRTGVSVKRVQTMTLLDWKGLSSQRTSGQIVGVGHATCTGLERPVSFASSVHNASLMIANLVCGSAGLRDGRPCAPCMGQCSSNYSGDVVPRCACPR